MEREREEERDIPRPSTIQETSFRDDNTKAEKSGQFGKLLYDGGGVLI